MRSASLEATDAVGAFEAKHPRVSLDDIKGAIRSIYYTTADQGVLPSLKEEDREVLSIFTICIVVMKNGFIVMGKSAPASPDNYDSDKGQLFAYEDAVRQLWPLMGFALRDFLHANRANVAEKANVDERR